MLRRRDSRSLPAFRARASITCTFDIRIYIVRSVYYYSHRIVSDFQITQHLVLFTTAVLALSKRNSNAIEIILFLHRLTQVLVEYFKELEEESIRDNFVIIYELMDEMMDFGYPQTTESKILQE
jgi:hypothetical protein